MAEEAKGIIEEKGPAAAGAVAGEAADMAGDAGGGVAAHAAGRDPGGIVAADAIAAAQVHVPGRHGMVFPAAVPASAIPGISQGQGPHRLCELGLCLGRGGGPAQGRCGPPQARGLALGRQPLAHRSLRPVRRRRIPPQETPRKGLQGPEGQDIAACAGRQRDGCGGMVSFKYQRK